jgi:hypothetical protein
MFCKFGEMHKFPITEFKKFADLPLEKLDVLNFSIYILDFDWNYLYVNNFVKKNLGTRGEDLIGKNMWKEFPELAADASFNQLRKSLDKRVVANLVTVSPVNSQRLNIVGYPMDDCFYFSASILPNKGDLLQELRTELSKKTGPKE